jgi:hypothetical protein
MIPLCFFSVTSVVTTYRDKQQAKIAQHNERI